MKIEGKYLSGKTSRQQDACLEVFDDGQISLALLAPENRISIDETDIKIASRLGNTPREISLGDNQQFITDDNNGADELAKLITGKNASFLHSLESRLPVIFVSLIFTILFVIGSVKYGVPKSAEFIAHQLPDFTIEQFSDGLAVLDNSFLEPSQLSEEETYTIRQLFQPYLEAHAHLRPELHFRSGIGPNALALPGGEIVFTDEFIELAENDNELIAVLLHELGHLEHKHMARRAIQDVMITLMVLFIIGDMGSADIVAGLPTLLLDLSYSRDFEREADVYALQKLHEAKLPLDTFASIMRRLHEYEDKDSDSSFEFPVYLSTHPGAKERISLVDDFRKQHSVQTEE